MENHIWKLDTLLNLFSKEEARQIQKLKCPHVNCEDMLCWTATKNGIFSVKSCYSSLSNEDREVGDVWALIWGSKIHERLKLFLWRFASNILQVNLVVAGRVGKGDQACSLYGQREEEVIHLFIECHVFRALAFVSKWSLWTSSLIGGSPKEMVQNLLSKLG